MGISQEEENRRRRQGVLKGNYDLDPPLPLGYWQAPSEVEADDDGIRWRLVDDAGAESTTGRGMLKGFLRLTDADSDTVARYARKWGVLGLCSHGLPETHGIELGDKLRRPLAESTGPCRLQRAEDKSWWYEPLAAWQALALETNTILTLSVEIHDGGLGEPSHWEQLPDYPFAEVVEPPVSAGPQPVEFRRDWVPTPGEPPETLDQARRLLGRHVDRWLHWGQVRNRLVWDGPSPTLEIQPHGLFGAIAMQLASRITGKGAVAICHNCHMPYTPERKPAPNRRNYCPDCREAGAPKRDAQRAWRAGETTPRKKKGSA